MPSYLDLINACDTFPQPGTPAYTGAVARLISFRVAASPSHTLGYVLPDVAATFAADEPAGVWHLDPVNRTLILTASPDAAARTAAVAATLARMRVAKRFTVLDKWRDEQYGVYGGPTSDDPAAVAAPDGPSREPYGPLFTMERAAAALLGVVTYGVHMTAFVRTDGGGMKVWVPRRARTKQTFPGALDNSVAGGLDEGDASARACLARECVEEASLGRDVAGLARPAGCVTYFYVSGEGSAGEAGLMQPECQFVYDLDLTGRDDVMLRPNDDEVEGFELMSILDIETQLSLGNFKPNSALVMLDFLIRHGLLSPAVDDYIQIVSRLHRNLEFPLRRLA